MSASRSQTSRRPPSPRPAAGHALQERRRATLPAISYPPTLPITPAATSCVAAIGGHQVVVVAGETGSGKTTQLPKMCLELGRGVARRRSATPSRGGIAARAVAERIAAELGVPLGQAVGYAVRFTDRTATDTLVKLMTDGLLLAEIAAIRSCAATTRVIVDEAHERSLNIDFLLGYLRRCCRGARTSR